MVFLLGFYFAGFLPRHAEEAKGSLRSLGITGLEILAIYVIKINYVA